MLFTKVIAPVFVLASTVLADGASITDAINGIIAATADLNNTVAGWKGDLLGALPITFKSAALLADIKNGTATAKRSDALTLLDALGPAAAVQSLVADVNLTLATIVASKSKFDHLLLSPVTLLNLELEKAASKDLGAAIKEKVPAEAQSIAQGLADQIDAAFVAAIAVYNPF